MDTVGHATQRLPAFRPNAPGANHRSDPPSDPPRRTEAGRATDFDPGARPKTQGCREHRPTRLRAPPPRRTGLRATGEGLFRGAAESRRPGPDRPAAFHRLPANTD